MNGTRRLYRSTLGAVLALAACAAVCPRAAAVDFLIPGVSLQSVTLIPGARVSYLVTAESFGARDSSYVELRVVDRRKGSFGLEIFSSPYPRRIDGSMTVRLRIADRFAGATTPEALRACLGDVRVRDGAGAFRKATEKELDELDLDRLFLRPGAGAERRSLGAARVATPAGAFECDGVEISRTETTQVSLGGVQAERGESETSVVWRSPRVPLWGVVKSAVDRKTWTVSNAAGVRGEPRETRTQSLLLSFRAPKGSAAKAR